MLKRNQNLSLCPKNHAAIVISLILFVSAQPIGVANFIPL